MSQRRGGGGSGSAKESGGGSVSVEKNEEILPFSKSLDPSSSSDGLNSSLQVGSPPNSGGPGGEISTSGEVVQQVGGMSLDERYHAETQQLKTKQWQECHFARVSFFLYCFRSYHVLSCTVCMQSNYIYGCEIKMTTHGKLFTIRKILKSTHRASLKVAGNLNMLSIKTTVGKVHV